MLKTTLIIVLTTISVILNAQTITNVQARCDGKNISISYTLQCTFSSDITLYISVDGGYTFNILLKDVTGDLGKGVLSGNKIIYWKKMSGLENSSPESILFRVEGVESKFGYFIDLRDNKKYKTVKIGKQIWMADNLNTEADQENSWCYNNNEKNCAIYGKLYSWQVANNICPDGWHLPSDEEWDVLESVLHDKVGDKIKEEGTLHWIRNRSTDTNESGFSGLPGGYYRIDLKSFINIGTIGTWWSSTATGKNEAWDRSVIDDNSHLIRYFRSKKNGLSVRCLKN
jgi:uncharacterized protein (TIGR02145 family)